MRNRTRGSLEQCNLSCPPPRQSSENSPSCTIELGQLLRRDRIRVLSSVQSPQKRTPLHGSATNVERPRSQGAELVVIESNFVGDETIETRGEAFGVVLEKRGGAFFGEWEWERDL